MQTLNYIEDEDIDNLPEEVFVKGFLRAYAKVVGADGDEAVKLYLSTLYSEIKKEKSEIEGDSVQNPETAETSTDNRKDFKAETNYIKKESSETEPEKKGKKEAGDKGKKFFENKGKKETGNRGKKTDENKESSQTVSDRGTENKGRNKFIFYLIIMGILSCLITLSVFLIFAFQSKKTDNNAPVIENHDAPLSETPVIRDGTEDDGSDIIQNNEKQIPSSEKKDDSPAQGTTEQSGSQRFSGGNSANTVSGEEVGSSLRLEPTVTPESGKTQDVSNQNAGSQEASSEKLVLKINAVEKTWMRVVIDDKETKDYILNPGDNREVKALSGFQLTIGNVKGVNLMLNDAPVSLAGERGSGGVLKMKIP